jgi:AcrR family transcriptional regulator
MCKVLVCMNESLTGDPGRRERKKAELRRALQRAALRLAVEQGYEHLTAEAIAEACDVSTRTFFNYFSSKDEALIGPILDHKRRMRAAFDARPASESVLQSLRAASVELADGLPADRGEWRTRRQVFEQNPALLPRAHAAFGELERSLTDAVALRLGVDPLADPYPALVVALAITALRVAVMHLQATGGVDEDLPELVGRMFDATFTTPLENRSL